MEIEILYFEGCPNVELAEDRAREATSGRSDVSVVRRRIRNEADAQRWGMYGSPTILVDGTDPFTDPDSDATWACRIFFSPEGASGVPTVGQLREAIG